MNEHPPPRTLSESHEISVQMLEAKSRALLAEKRAEIAAVLSVAATTAGDAAVRAAHVAELRAEEADLEADNTEYIEYLAAFSNLIVSQTRPAADTEPRVRPIQGPMGQFVTRTVNQNDGKALQEHEETYAAPLRAWHRNHEDRLKAGGARVKKKRVRRRPPTAADVDRATTVRCAKCGGGMVQKAVEGTWVCLQDGHINMVDNVDSSTASRGYGECMDMFMETNRGGYRKANHLAECLHQRMGHESTHIPPEVIDTFMLERRKHPWIKTEDITWKHVREWLKKHGLSKWYEHIPRIYHLATGYATPSLDQAQMSKVRAMFQMLEEPFQTKTAQSRGRSNFLSYEYTLYKICELCGYDDMLPGFKLLKSPEKLKNHDDLWKYFCEQLNWQFIPTPAL